MMKGIITEVQGPVVDVLFPEGQLPFIKDALTVQNGEQKCVMEVAQHMGGNIVRCIMLSPSEGLCREMEVTAEGGGIQVPVGDRTLGRLFNVTGEIIDGGEPLPVHPPRPARLCRPEPRGGDPGDRHQGH